jgi:ketosteroid isomerase-like protein
MRAMTISILAGALALAGCAASRRTTRSASRSASQAGAADSGDAQALAQIEREWSAILTRGDAAALDRLLAEDFLGLAPDGSGRLLDKAQWLALVRADTSRPAYAVEEGDLTVRVYGSTALVWLMVTAKGETGTERQRFLDVYVKQDGRWRPVASNWFAMPQR